MPQKQKLIQITITYGYDIHTLELPQSTYLNILKGDEIEVSGQGFSIEGQVVQDFWRFGKGCLDVYCEDGFEVFTGNLSDAVTNIEELEK